MADLQEGGRGPGKCRVDQRRAGVSARHPSVFCAAPGPVLIQHIMSKLLLAAAPIETLIKAIRGSSWGGAGGSEDVVNSSYVVADGGEREGERWLEGGTW